MPTPKTTLSGRFGDVKRFEEVEFKGGPFLELHEPPDLLPSLLHLNVKPMPAPPQTFLGLPEDVSRELVQMTLPPNRTIVGISPLVRTGFKIWGLAPLAAQPAAFIDTLHKDTLGAQAAPPSMEIANELRQRLVLTLAPNADMAAVIARLKRLPSVAVVEPVPAMHAPTRAEVADRPVAHPAQPGAKTTDDDKPDWFHVMTSRRNPNAVHWNTTAYANIAILDSGVQQAHPSIAGAAKTVSDREWFNYPLDDVYGHGTHVASLIMGRTTPANNLFAAQKLQQGVLPASTPWCYNVFERKPKGINFEVDFYAFYTALFTIRKKHKVDVVNMSIWMKEASDTLRDEFGAAEKAGILMVACAGNNFNKTVGDLGKDSGYRVLYPARLPNVISVAAIDGQYQRAPFSRFTTWNGDGKKGNDSKAFSAGRRPFVDIAAPGVRMWGAVPGQPAFANASIAPDLVAGQHGAARLRGTSMAAPLVAAGLAALRHKNPSLKPADVRALLPNCVHTTNMQTNFGSPIIQASEALGHGLIDFGILATK